MGQDTAQEGTLCTQIGRTLRDKGEKDVEALKHAILKRRFLF